MFVHLQGAVVGVGVLGVGSLEVCAVDVPVTTVLEDLDPLGDAHVAAGHRGRGAPDLRVRPPDDLLASRTPVAPFSKRIMAVKSLRQSEPRAFWKAVASVTSLPAMYLIRSTAWQTSFQMVVRGRLRRAEHILVELAHREGRASGLPDEAHRLPGHVGKASLEPDGAHDAVRLGGFEEGVGLLRAGACGLLDEYVPAGVHAVDRYGRHELLAHDHVHNVRGHGVDHLAVVAKGLGYAVPVDDLAHAGLVELGDRLDARVLQPADGSGSGPNCALPPAPTNAAFSMAVSCRDLRVASALLPALRADVIVGPRQGQQRAGRREGSPSPFRRAQGRLSILSRRGRRGGSPHPTSGFRCHMIRGTDWGLGSRLRGNDGSGCVTSSLTAMTGHTEV